MCGLEHIVLYVREGESLLTWGVGELSVLEQFRKLYEGQFSSPEVLTGRYVGWYLLSNKTSKGHWPQGRHDQHKHQGIIVMGKEWLITVCNNCSVVYILEQWRNRGSSLYAACTFKLTDTVYTVTYSNSYKHSYTDGGGCQARCKQALQEQFWGSVSCPRTLWHAEEKSRTGEVAQVRSGMGGTDPFTRVSVEAKPALYWPSLLKQSDVKWLAHTYKLTWTRAGTLSLKNETQPLSLLLFCSWDRI